MIDAFLFALKAFGALVVALVVLIAVVIGFFEVVWRIQTREWRRK